MPSYFTPGTPLYTDDGGDILKGPRRVEAAKRLLGESGYAGEPVTVMAAQDITFNKAWGEVTVDLLKRLDMKVDLAAVDWGTAVARRAQKSPPHQGGWQMGFGGYHGSEGADPTNRYLHANGNELLMVGRIIRKSRPRSARGMMRRAWTRRRRLYAGSTGWPSIMSSLHR